MRDHDYRDHLPNVRDGLTHRLHGLDEGAFGETWRWFGPLVLDTDLRDCR